MSTVRFGTACDRCGLQSPDYEAWPRCRVCGGDVCPTCQAPGSAEPADFGARATAVCAVCAGREA